MNKCNSNSQSENCLRLTRHGWPWLLVRHFVDVSKRYFHARHNHNGGQYFSGMERWRDFLPLLFQEWRNGVEQKWIFLERSGKGVQSKNNGVYTSLHPPVCIGQLVYTQANSHFICFWRTPPSLSVKHYLDMAPSMIPVLHPIIFYKQGFNEPEEVLSFTLTVDSSNMSFSKICSNFSLN